METRFYAVIASETQQGIHLARRFNNLEEADQAAKERKGKLYEYKDRPLGNGENHEDRGILIRDYSESK